MPEPKPSETPETCPECGVDLTNRDPWAHALDHWPEKISNPESFPEAVKRQKYLRDLAKKRGLL